MQTPQALNKSVITAAPVGPSLDSRKTPKTSASLRSIYRLRVLTSLVAWLCLFVWNLTSPIKNWVLGRYEISNSDRFVSKGLDWTDQLDYGYVKFLYDHAGIRCDFEPGKPVRLVNVYVDFLVLQKAQNWASGINTWHQDALIGRYCQSGLREKRQAQHQDLLRFVDNVYPMWERNVPNIFPDQTNCRLNEVPEAILCLKGYNASQLINLEWSTGMDVTLPENHEALAAWQAKLLPDLNNCLDRRRYWLQVQQGNRGAALNALAQELAANFSLNLHGFAGKNNLMTVYYQQEGFVDISGKQAGRRTVAISGIITERNRYNMDGDVNAVTAIRELLWLCVFARPNKASMKQCLENEALVVTAFFLGNEYNLTVDQLATRYIDDNTLVSGGTMGNKTVWNYKPVVFPAPVVKYLLNGSVDGVESAYAHQVDVVLVAQLLGQSIPNDAASGFVLSWKCVYEPGCFDFCHNVTERTADIYMFYAIKRSGYCYRHRLSTELLNRNGFVTKECYGIGKGNHTLLYELNRAPAALAMTGFSEPLPEYVELQHVVDPMMTLACIMGGRLPADKDNPFPTEFHDMMALGTGMTMSIIFSDGTEQVLLNTYALFSLVGTVFYSFFVFQEGSAVYRVVRRGVGELNLRGRLQLLASVSCMSIANRVWHQRYPFLVVFGFFTVFSWTVGASKAMCKWHLDGVPVREIPVESLDTSVTPEYRCQPGAIGGPLASTWEIVRFLSASSVVSNIVLGRTALLGVHRSVRAMAAKELLIGGVPTLIIYVIVTALNHVRVQIDQLATIHTQLHFAVLWTVLMYICQVGMVAYSKVFYGIVALCRLHQQSLATSSEVFDYVESYVAYPWEQHGDQDAIWIPLSVLLEVVPRQQLVALDLKARCFEVHRARHRSPVVAGLSAVRPDSSAKSSMANEKKLSSRQADPVVAPWMVDAHEMFICTDPKSCSLQEFSAVTASLTGAAACSPQQKLIPKVQES